MIGINDAAMQLESSRDLKIVLDEFEHTYEKLMKESIEKGMIIHCMTPFYIDSSTSRPFDSPSPLLQLTLRYIDRIKIVCDRLNIPLLNIHDIFQDKLRQSEANYWSSDGVHPYEHGHMLIAKELFKWVINEN